MGHARPCRPQRQLAAYTLQPGLGDPTQVETMQQSQCSMWKVAKLTNPTKSCCCHSPHEKGMLLGARSLSRCCRLQCGDEGSARARKLVARSGISADHAPGAARQHVTAAGPAKQVFRFRHFDVAQGLCRATHKVGTDAMLLGAWCHPGSARRALDVGTGTGVLALMVAQRAKHVCHIDAIDVDAAAAQQAAANVAASPWAQRIAAHHASLQDWLAVAEANAGSVCGEDNAVHYAGISASNGSSVSGTHQPATYSQPRLHSYDLVISNPPYFLNSSKPGTSQRAAARHADVLLPFSVLAQGAAALLAPGGALAVVLPVSEGEVFATEAAKERLVLTRVCRVRTRAADAAPKRVLMRFERLAGAGDSVAGAARVGALQPSSNCHQPCSDAAAQLADTHSRTQSAEQQELVITERVWSNELGQEQTEFTAAYRALTHEFHHPDYM